MRFHIVFRSKASGVIEHGRIFGTLAAARKHKAWMTSFADDVRILAGGPGGMECF